MLNAKARMKKLCLSLLFATSEKSSESVIFLDHTKSPFDLYRTICAQQYTVRCTDAGLSVTFLLKEYMRNSDHSVLIPAFETLIPMRTSGTVPTDIIPLHRHETIIGLSLSVANIQKLFSVWAGIAV